MRTRYSKGFTLIELLVVISIIGILASMAYVSYVNSQLAARDTQRRSDINQYRVKLEQYASTATSGTYPANASSATMTWLCSASALNMPLCLHDPVNPADSATDYRYISDSAGIPYKLWAKLEAVTNGYWEVCSTGQSGVVAPPKTVNTTTATCDL